MKKIIFILLLFVITSFVWGQTWTVEADEDIDLEITVITEESFLRILKANEITATAATLSYTDVSEDMSAKVIKGSAPELKGYYYLSKRIIPKTPTGKLGSGYIKSTIEFGHTETGRVSIVYLTTEVVPGAFAFRMGLDRYRKKLGELAELVDGK